MCIRDRYQALLGAVYQNFSLVPASIAQNVAQDLEDFDRARVQNCLERAGLGADVYKRQGALCAIWR